ncbi:winged helix-turn-helix domain-containing protein [Streptomyces sp. NBC_01013]|uniref:winged helix-turn-helix domain-containing protein n=1 Tax=Streptomyces sp. NBC_01013 TaxID=2903718 RepID=UPI003869BDEA|nr:helix-turn-helix domain-containing protein [Streptomyces sp. NBC_01013]
MSDENRQVPCVQPLLDRARPRLPDHPVRVALLDLLAEAGTVTSTQAAARLGHSSGLCSFHLRQLARHGLIEEVPHSGGRARPWRLRWTPTQGPDGPDTEAQEEFASLASGLVDDGHQQRPARREQEPGQWHHDESFSTVLHLTPAEMAELGSAIRRLLACYRDRETPAHPSDVVAVVAVSRLFPSL